MRNNKYVMIFFINVIIFFTSGYADISTTIETFKESYKSRLIRVEKICLENGIKQTQYNIIMHKYLKGIELEAKEKEYILEVASGSFWKENSVSICNLSHLQIMSCIAVDDFSHLKKWKENIKNQEISRSALVASYIVYKEKNDLETALNIFESIYKEASTFEMAQILNIFSSIENGHVFLLRHFVERESPDENTTVNLSRFLIRATLLKMKQGQRFTNGQRLIEKLILRINTPASVKSIFECFSKTLDNKNEKDWKNKLVEIKRKQMNSIIGILPK